MSGKDKNIRQRISDQDIIDAIKNNQSYYGALKSLQLNHTTNSNNTWIRDRVLQLNIQTNHFTGQGHLKGSSHGWGKKIPLEEILVKNSKYTTSNHLRKRLIKENILEEKCSICNLSEWLGKRLGLEIDHINGDNKDNRLENLRILCPNCHSQTPTYCSKNKR